MGQQDDFQVGRCPPEFTNPRLDDGLPARHARVDQDEPRPFDEIHIHKARHLPVGGDRNLKRNLDGMNTRSLHNKVLQKLPPLDFPSPAPCRQKASLASSATVPHTHGPATSTTRQPPPVTIRPILRSRPLFVNGTPIARDSRAFAALTPVNRFHEKPPLFISCLPPSKPTRGISRLVSRFSYASGRLK